MATFLKEINDLADYFKKSSTCRTHIIPLALP
ncbi:Uncharacterised protein [Leclercia adecarboxylata]|uniref:Uncharacterized protein n=1 Tax=Leclercia adecarboxylata TaxID=83655 RepID=A0A4U9IL76_9ENTR|nr:Uncharacterised protein [Leclercia adecarboxylata]